MYYTTKSPSLQRLSPDKGKWVAYQLKLRNLTHADIALRAVCSRPTVSNVLAGRFSSSNVYNVLCSILGFSTMNELLEHPRRGAA